MSILLADVIKLLIAIVIGGLIGAEREYRHRSAGFRTIIFICVGATLFTILSLRLGGDTSPVRIAAHMVTGVGFICAGVIMEEGDHLVGLTTAAIIWLVAAIGMGIGGGQFLLAFLATAAMMTVLWLFPKVEQRIYNVQDKRTYEISSTISQEIIDDLCAILEQCDLNPVEPKLLKNGDEMTSIWDVFGPPEKHKRFVDKLLSDPHVKSFKY
jgi:putative Mg2+ transporter-C (MgtC) family protein